MDKYQAKRNFKLTIIKLLNNKIKNINNQDHMSMPNRKRNLKKISKKYHKKIIHQMIIKNI